MIINHLSRIMVNCITVVESKCFKVLLESAQNSDKFNHYVVCIFSIGLLTTKNEFRFGFTSDY